MSLERELFIDMMSWGYIGKNSKFKQGMLMNDLGKQLLIKKVFPDRSHDFVDVYMEYAHVVLVNNEIKSDPAVVLGFDVRRRIVYPVSYRNDLLDHTINIYDESGAINEDQASWLLEYFSGWFREVNSDEYDYFDEAELVSA